MAEPTLLYSDLDERPYLTDRVLELFKRSGPGRAHAVHGEPWRMGLPPRSADFDQSLGVMFAMIDGHPEAAFCICPYSEEQVTLWGPCFRDAFNSALTASLLSKCKRALANGSISSYRILVDQRNRLLRDFVLNHGMQKFKDNILFTRPLQKPTELPAYPVDLAKGAELQQVEDLLLQAFPDNGHCGTDLQERCDEGYLHYVLRVRNHIRGCAVVSRHRQRSWLSMICIDSQARGQGLAKHLLSGVINNEYGHQAHELALEVLADNQAAIALYNSTGFEKQWTASIYTGPI